MWHGEQIALLGLDLGVKHPFVADPPPALIDLNKITNIESAHRAQHHPGHGIGDKGGRGEGDNTGQQYPEQAEYLPAGHFGERQLNNNQYQRQQQCRPARQLPAQRHGTAALLIGALALAFAQRYQHGCHQQCDRDTEQRRPVHLPPLHLYPPVQQLPRLADRLPVAGAALNLFGQLKI